MLLCTAMAFAFTACETSGPDTDDPAGQEENNGGNGGNGEENPDGEDNPGDDGKVRVRKITQGNEEDGMTWEFEYDGDNIVRLSATDYYNLADETYDITYGDNTIEVLSSRQYWDDEDVYAVKYIFSIDGNGTVTGGTENWTSGDEGSGTFSLDYDGSGFLTGIQYDGDWRDESNLFSWTSGNLTGNKFTTEDSHYGARESEYTFVYSDSPNNINIDLNWLLSNSYYAAGTTSEWTDLSLALMGMTGHLGRPSENLVTYVPTNEYEYTEEDYFNFSNGEPIEKDGIYPFTMETPVYKVEGGQYTFNDEGMPVSLTRTTKVYVVGYEWSVKKTITDYSAGYQPDGPDGPTLYPIYDEEVLGVKEISREVVDEISSAITISY